MPADARAPSTRTAVIIGASSGIGAALAHELHRDGWRLGLLARRRDRLEAVATAIGSATTVVRTIDVGQPDAATTLEQTIDELGGVDLVVVSAGTGHNAALEWALDVDTVDVNILGFMAMCQVAMRHFFAKGRGHLVGISSIAALRGNPAASYAASKAFQSVYLDGLRQLAREKGHAVVVTEIQPGGVDTEMLKPAKPLPPLVRRLFVASPSVAAAQIRRAIEKQKKHAYVTRRYRLVALALKLLPRPG